MTEESSEQVYIESDEEKECVIESNRQDFQLKNDIHELNNDNSDSIEEENLDNCQQKKIKSSKQTIMQEFELDKLIDSDSQQEQTGKQKEIVSKKKKIQKQNFNLKRGSKKKIINHASQDQNNFNGSFILDQNNEILIFIIKLKIDRNQQACQSFKLEYNQDIKNQIQIYINEYFTESLFIEINKYLLADGQKYIITQDDIKRFCAVLLFTGLAQVDSIMDFFENNFLLLSNLIPFQVFSFISFILQDDNQILNKLSNLIQRLPSENYKDQKRQIISSNYLKFFQDYYFDIENKNIQMINNSKIELSQIQNKASFKKQIDSTSQTNNILNHNQSNLQIQDKSFHKQLNKTQQKQYNESPSTTEQERYAFCFDLKNLSLVSIQNINFNQESNSNQNSYSKSQDDQDAFTPQTFLIDQENPNPNSIRKTLFKNLKQNSIQSDLLKIYLKKRPLTKINLEKFECFGIRALSEIIYSLCIQAFEKLIFNIQKTQMQNTNMLTQNILEQLFKELLNQVIHLLTNSQNLQQILIHDQQANQYHQNSSNKNNQVIIVLKRHSLQKKEHCNFCLVCKYNYEHHEQNDHEVISLKSTKKDNEKKKKIKKEYIEENQDDKNRKKKSKYQCIQCTEFYGRSISLCVEKCDELFHENPYKYLNRIKFNQNVISQQEEKIVQQLPKITTIDNLQQIQYIQELIKVITMKIHSEELIAQQNIFDIIKYQKAKKKNKKGDDSQQQSELKNNQYEQINKNEQNDIFANLSPDISTINYSKNPHKDENIITYQNPLAQNNLDNEKLFLLKILKNEDTQEQSNIITDIEDNMNLYQTQMMLVDALDKMNMIKQEDFQQQYQQLQQKKNIKEENIEQQQQQKQNFNNNIYIQSQNINVDNVNIQNKVEESQLVNALLFPQQIKMEQDQSQIDTQRIKTENQ